MQSTIAAACLAVFIYTILPEQLAFATEQIKEQLNYNGSTYRLSSFPLEGYFKQGGGRPQVTTMHTGCWRGYVAGWEIKKGYLQLQELRDCNRKLPLVLSGKRLPLRATWFTGTLRLLLPGQQQPRSHMGVPPRKKEVLQELRMDIKRGKLVKAYSHQRQPRKE